MCRGEALYNLLFCLLSIAPIWLAWIAFSCGILHARAHRSRVGYFWLRWHVTLHTNKRIFFVSVVDRPGSA